MAPSPLFPPLWLAVVARGATAWGTEWPLGLGHAVPPTQGPPSALALAATYGPTLLAVAVAAAAYVAGWRRLLTAGRGLAGGRHLASYLAGLAAFVIALTPPLDPLAEEALLAHMVQHLLLIMVVPPLVLLARPLPVALWGLPRRLRRAIGHLLARRSAVGRGVRTVGAPPVAWILLAATTLGWHDPRLYDLALEEEAIHALEHASMLAAGIIFWATVVGASPLADRLATPFRRALFLLSAVPIPMGVGLSIAFAPGPLYAHYLSEANPWGLSVMADQQLGGAVMWIAGGMMLVMAALAYLASGIAGDDPAAGGRKVSIGGGENFHSAGPGTATADTLPLPSPRSRSLWTKTRALTPRIRLIAPSERGVVTAGRGRTWRPARTLCREG